MYKAVILALALTGCAASSDEKAGEFKLTVEMISPDCSCLVTSDKAALSTTERVDINSAVLK